MADFDKDPCRTERLAFLLRQDIIGMPCTMPWLSTDERELYRQAVFNTYRRLREPVDGTVGENIALVDKQVKLAIKGIAVMARGRAVVSPEMLTSGVTAAPSANCTVPRIAEAVPTT